MQVPAAVIVTLLVAVSGVAQEKEKAKPRPVNVAGCVQAGVEAGCVVLVTAEGEKFNLLGQKEVLPQPGTFVHVKGAAGGDIMSFCMEGEPLQIRETRLLEKSCPQGERREPK